MLQKSRGRIVTGTDRAGTHRQGTGISMTLLQQIQIRGGIYRVERLSVSQNLLFRYSLPMRNQGVDCVPNVKKIVLFLPKEYYFGQVQNIFFIVS
jgi:hypothetical protein